AQSPGPRRGPPRRSGDAPARGDPRTHPGGPRFDAPRAPVLKCMPVFARRRVTSHSVSSSSREKESHMSSFIRNRTGFSGLLPGVLMMVLGLCACLPASSVQDKAAKAGAVTDPAKVLATVNGKSITAGEVEAASTAEFQQIDRQCSQQKHDLIEGKLKQMVQDQMVEAEAKAKGVTKEVLLADAT